MIILISTVLSSLSFPQFNEPAPSNRTTHSFEQMSYKQMNSSSNQQSQQTAREKNEGEAQLLSQAEIEEKQVTLKSVLMLTQLNSSFYELGLTLQKKLGKFEDKFCHAKMKAFLQLTIFKRNRFQSRTLLSNNINENSASMTLPVCQGQDSPANIPQKEEQPSNQLQLKCQIVLNKLIVILKNKQTNLLSYSFTQLDAIFRNYLALKIKSDKQSKIETTDSHRSKIFKRSAEKRIYHKSFSMQKSALEQKHQSFIAVKYQPQSKIIPPTNIKNINPPIQSESHNPPSLYINKNPSRGEAIHERRNLMTANRERTGLLKSNSTKKITTPLSNERQDKMQELEYLKRKYSKLITEFNWFSDRFLKVIEEEEYVK